MLPLSPATLPQTSIAAAVHQLTGSAGQPVNVFQPGTFHSGEVWESIEGFRQTVSLFLVELSENLRLATLMFIQAGVDTGPIAVTVRGMQKDIQSAFDKLILLYEQHKNKSGSVNSVEEYSLYLGLGMEYMQINEHYRALLLPPMTMVTEFQHGVMARMNATNPDVVTDVQIKTVH